MIHIHFAQTGDPWHDWGLCELYEVVRDPVLKRHLMVSEPSSSGFTVESELTEEEFGKVLHSVLARSDRWNAVYPRFEEGKKVTRCYPRIENGRRVPGEKYAPKVNKAEWEAADCRGNPPSTFRNRCQRIANITLTPKQLETLMLPNGGVGSFEEIATNAVRLGATGELTQGANPLVAKHHSNGKVRGPSGSNTSLEVPAYMLLPCFCATVSPWKPFVKNDDCVVFLPENMPFPRAIRLWRQFTLRGALIHPDEANGEMYRNLPLRADGDAAQLLILLDSLQDRLSVRDIDGLFGEEITLLNDWQAIHFSSGTNINIGGIYRIEVPGEVFPLLKPIPGPAYWKQQTQVKFVNDCLTGLRVEDVTVQSHIAEALFLINRNPRDAWSKLKTVAMTLYKNADRAGMTSRSAAQLLSHFYQQFARSLLTMTESQLESCRKIGELAGNAFHHDVTILSRLHNTSSPGDFRTNMELLAFRLFKASMGEDKQGLWHISSEEFTSILNLATTDEWQSAAQTISAFASLKAFNNNLQEGTKKP